MADEYIKREAAIAVIYGQHVGGKEACENARPNTYGADLREIVSDIEDIPAADVQPVRHGRWNVYSAKHGLYSCSECHCVPAFLHSPYCPNCGAKMDAEAQE